LLSAFFRTVAARPNPQASEQQPQQDEQETAQQQREGHLGPNHAPKHMTQREYDILHAMSGVTELHVSGSNPCPSPTDIMDSLLPPAGDDDDDEDAMDQEEGTAAAAAAVNEDMQVSEPRVRSHMECAS
jgi:hypothetical protein